MSQEQAHISVMLNEVLEMLQVQDEGIYLDGTFGAGGYSRAILENANCQLIAIDRDPNVKPYADTLQSTYGQRFQFAAGCFSEMQHICQTHNVPLLDGIVLDLGVSSMQIDQADRGFSFMQDGELSMQMGEGSRDAKELVNQASEEDIANIIYHYGEERHSRKIARAIVQGRENAPITTTGRLSDIICSVMKRAKDGIHPATRSFQAIRIWVNDELGELEKALVAAQVLLKENGRLVIVSFHSLEDAIVKNFLRYASGRRDRGSRYLPDVTDDEPITFSLLNRKPIIPTQEEIKQNIRSRSARLRAAQRVNQSMMYIKGEEHDCQTL